MSRNPIAPAAAEATTAVTDGRALDGIAHMLRDPEWGVGMLEDIADLVSGTGRSIQGVCAACSHPAYNTFDERCEADGCACPRHEQGPTWDRH
jgi:hypothetical protein